MAAAGPATPQRERRGSLAGLFSPGGLFSPAAGRAPSGGGDAVPVEAIPGVEAICVQLQEMDEQYRALVGDLEEHAAREVKAARQLAKTAEALALVAVVDGEAEGDWGVWSALGSSVLAQSQSKLALYKTQVRSRMRAMCLRARTRAPSRTLAIAHTHTKSTRAIAPAHTGARRTRARAQAVAPSAEVRQKHLWEEGGALYTPAVALITAIRDLVDGVLARAVAARTQYRDTLAEASLQVRARALLSLARACALSPPAHPAPSHHPPHTTYHTGRKNGVSGQSG